MPSGHIEPFATIERRRRRRDGSGELLSKVEALPARSRDNEQMKTQQQSGERRKKKKKLEEAVRAAHIKRLFSADFPLRYYALRAATKKPLRLGLPLVGAAQLMPIWAGRSR